MHPHQAHALRLLDALIAAEGKEAQQRGTTLLACANPREGYSRIPADEFCVGWAFTMDPACADPLDIQLQERTRKKVKYYAWTQGSAFHFKQGYTIHRADDGMCVQVQEARPAVPAQSGTPRDPGHVTLQTHVPSTGPTAWKKDKSISMTQDELVRFLIAQETAPPPAQPYAIPFEEAMQLLLTEKPHAE